MAHVPRPLAIPTLLAALLPGCCAWCPADHEPVGEIELSVLARTARALDAANAVGTIRIDPSDDEMARAWVRVEYRGGEEALGRRALPGDFVLEVKDGVLAARPAAYGTSAQDLWKMEIDLRVPSGVRVSARTGVGDCRISGLPGPLRAESGVGAVAVSAAALAGADLSSGVGSVRLSVTLVPPEGDVTCRADVGDVTIRLPHGTSGEASLSAGVGSVRVRGAPGVAVRREAASSSASGRLGSGGIAISGKAGVGDVELDVGP